jgi:hypothetical protein
VPAQTTTGAAADPVHERGRDQGHAAAHDECVGRDPSPVVVHGTVVVASDLLELLL